MEMSEYAGYVIMADGDLTTAGDMQAVETALATAHPECDWQVRYPRQGEAVGTYGKMDDGSLQILGYSLPVPEDIETAIREAYESVLTP